MFAITAGVAAMLTPGVVLVAGQKVPAAVFTTEQATAGRAAYAKNCASCHMPDLTGNVEVPALAGAAFMGTWGTRSTKDLFDYMSAAMPYGAPSLSVESYTSIAAFILQSNGAVAGAAVLGSSTAVAIGSLTTPETNSSP